MPDRCRSVAAVLACLAAWAAGACAGRGPEPAGEGAVPLLSDVHQLTFEGRRAGEGYFGAAGRRLVFQSEREPGNPFFQIYLLDLETGDTRRVSPGVGKTTCAWLHPSGERVLFASTHLDPGARAEQERELAERASGAQRRYAWDYDPHYDLFAAELASGELTRLTAARGYDAEGSYSPDGRLVAFASNRHAHAGTLGEHERALFERDPATAMEIYLMDADGSNVRRLTTTPGYDGGPFFSPDGRRIVWRRFSEDGHRAEIYSMALDGSDVRQLTTLGALSWAPFYHPSGEYVIFSTNRHGFGNFELYLVDAEGRREPVRVTDSPGFDGLPAFSPDGRRLAWTSGRTPSGASQIFLADWSHAAARALLAGRPPPVASEHASGGGPPSDDTVRELRRHVAALASEEMAGRRTGTPGEERATRYVADAFDAAGLEPDGDDGGWFQRFAFTAGISLGTDNALRLRAARSGVRALEVGTDFRPLSFSRTGEAGPAPVVFAGYGIVAPADGDAPAYDSFAELEVRGKWVLILRFLPEDLTPERRQHLHRYASLRHKAMVARDRGAAGLLVASGPHSKVREELVPLVADASIAATSLTAISVSDEAAQALLEPAGRDLGAVQQALDGGEPVPGFDVPGLAVEARVDLVQEKRSGRNVLGRLRAGAPGAAPVVIGAHVDHLGRSAGETSLAREDERGGIHFGADDNASGVAALIEVAERLTAVARERPGALRRDVVFAAWSGEELGLLGSDAWTRDLPDPHELAHGKTRTVAAYLNLDMVGRLRERLSLYGAGSSPIWHSQVERSNAGVGLAIALHDDSYLPTDATSFYLKGIPVLSAFTGSHDEYHTPRDTPEKLDYQGLADVTRLVTGLALALAERGELPEYAGFERPRDMGPRAGLRAYLGTIPSYTEGAGDGLTLSGVAEGGPAAVAGLRAGDRIVELAGRTVENIYDYTYAIDALEIGEPVPIVVIRDGRRLALDITPASRQ